MPVGLLHYPLQIPPWLPFALMPAGIVPTVSLVMCYDYCQYGPTVSVRSRVCIHLFSLLLHSGYAYTPVTVAGEWQEKWSNFTLATEDTSSRVLSMGGPRLVLGCSTAPVLPQGRRHSSSALLPKCVRRDPAHGQGSVLNFAPLHVILIQL